MMPYVSSSTDSSNGCIYSTSSRPCFRAMYLGIFSIGPGRYNATTAIISSKRSGFSPFSTSRMPLDSSWNNPTASPSPSMAKVSSHSSGISFNARSMPLRLIRSIACCRTVSVFSPRKSNLTSPASSTDFILNCVTGNSDAGSRVNGTNSANGRSPITNPAA